MNGVNVLDLVRNSKYSVYKLPRVYSMLPYLHNYFVIIFREFLYVKTESGLGWRDQTTMGRSRLVLSHVLESGLVRRRRSYVMNITWSTLFHNSLFYTYLNTEMSCFPNWLFWFYWILIQMMFILGIYYGLFHGYNLIYFDMRNVEKTEMNYIYQV